MISEIREETKIKKLRNQCIRCLPIVIIAGAVMMSTGCDEWITDNGPQPRYLDNSAYTPLLNVFGVLRPDSVNGLPLSFVHVEQAYPFNTSPDTIEITAAKVTLFKYEQDLPIDSMNLQFTNYDSTFATADYRDKFFVPQVNVTYGLSCIADGYPELTAQTTVPEVPQIKDDRIGVEHNKISFEIIRDSLAALYDVYLFMGQQAYTERIRRPEQGNISVTVAIEQHSETEALLIVYSYDLNLSEYLTYNVSIKPNTYRSAYSTVSNGFGCFGSLTVLKKVISF